MFKVLKNQDGFSGLIGILIAIVIIGIMSAMMLPTFTARMDYKQAQYIAGVTKTIENAENAYMAKNGSFANLVTLSQNGYLSPQFLQSLQPANNPGGPYPQPNWITLELAKQTVNLCIDNNGGCPDNPSGNNYFIGLYSVPSNYANYIEHELPGSGIGSQGGGLEYVAFSAPVPHAPPVVIPDNGATPAAKYTKTWLNTGFYQWTVPPGVTVVGVTLAGGNGGSSNGSGGIGGELTDQLLNVSPGENLDIYVAGNGGHFVSGGYGYAYGGNGSSWSVYSAAGGGGSSAVVSPDTGQVIMAPGGGGGGSGGLSSGGGGGYASGGDGSGGYGGGGNGGAGDGSGGNGGFPGGAGYNGNGASPGIMPGIGYPFVEIQWN
jgi:type II secretory pathway pseudopilin PulG